MPQKSHTKESLLKKIKKTKTGCWEWLGFTDIGGYGKVKFEGRQQPVHRVFYKLFKGEIPKGMFACHKCDNPPCANPDHIFIGTPKDNIQDAAKKGRMVKGSQVKVSKLNEEKVQEILAAKASGKYFWGGAELAKKFGVSRAYIFKLARRKTWKHIKPNPITQE